MSYPYRQPDFLESITKGLQVRSMVEGIRARREARALQGELHRQALEDRQRKAREDSFNMKLKLGEMGFIPAMPGDTGQNDAAISEAVGGISPENARPLMNTPVGDYRAPSQSDRFSRARTRAQQEGTLAGEKTMATQAVTDPNEEMEIPEELGGGKAQIPKNKKLDYALKIAEAVQKTKPKLEVHATQPNDAGEVTIWSRNPQTNEIKTEKILPGAGKTKTVAAGAQPIPNFDGEVKRLMDSWRQAHYNQLGITPEIVESAKGQGQDEKDDFGLSTGSKSNPAATRIKQAEDELYRRAVDSVKNNAKGAQTKGAAAAGKKEPVPASRLQSLLARPEVKARGIRDVNALRKDLMKMGYEIDEAK